MKKIHVKVVSFDIFIFKSVNLGFKFKFHQSDEASFQ